MDHAVFRRSRSILLTRPRQSCEELPGDIWCQAPHCTYFLSQLQGNHFGSPLLTIDTNVGPTAHEFLFLFDLSLDHTG